MAIEFIREKLTGDTDNASLPYYVHDPAGGTVSETAAIAAAEADAPAILFGNSQDGNPGVDQLVDNIWRITIRYNRGNYQTWVRDPRFNIRAVCEPWSGNYATEVGRYPASAVDSNGVVYSGRPPGVGGTQSPFSPVVGQSVRVALSSLNVSDVRTAARLARAGAIHNAAYGAYALGELALCQFFVQQVDQLNAEVTAGWSYIENVAGENRGGVAGVAYAGHDLVTELRERDVDRTALLAGQTVKSVYVYRPRPMADVITPTGLVPP